MERCIPPMTDEEKAREYADRIAEINSAVSSGKVNLEQARLNIETYKWLAYKLDPDNYGANSKTKSETDLNQMYLEALKQLCD